MDLVPGLRDSAHAMWIRPDRSLLARMPSLRPLPGATAPLPKAPAVPQRVEPPLNEEELRARGGFHESSYELRNGMDMIETEWPDDTTIPGLLDEL
jgi:hypothetical protein